MLWTRGKLHNIEHEMNFPRMLKARAVKQDKKTLSANNPEPALNMSMLLDLIIFQLMACLRLAPGDPCWPDFNISEA